MDADDLKTMDVNFELETKVVGQMEDPALAKEIIIKNHRKLRDNEKETFEKMVDDVKANAGHIVNIASAAGHFDYLSTEQILADYSGLLGSLKANLTGAAFEDLMFWETTVLSPLRIFARKLGKDAREVKRAQAATNDGDDDVKDKDQK